MSSSDDRPDLDHFEDEIEITVYKASGPGGQHKDKTASAVRVRHLPTGIISIATESRSQLKNRKVALERLRKRLEELYREPVPRRKTTVPKHQKEVRMQIKKAQSEKKALRRPPDPAED